MRTRYFQIAYLKRKLIQWGHYTSSMKAHEHQFSDFHSSQSSERSFCNHLAEWGSGQPFLYPPHLNPSTLLTEPPFHLPFSQTPRVVQARYTDIHNRILPLQDFRNITFNFMLSINQNQVLIISFDQTSLTGHNAFYTLFKLFSVLGWKNIPCAP